MTRPAQHFHDFEKHIANLSKFANIAKVAKGKGAKNSKSCKSMNKCKSTQNTAPMTPPANIFMILRKKCQTLSKAANITKVAKGKRAKS